MSYCRVLCETTGAFARFLLVALTVPAVLSCGLLTADRAPTPAVPPDATPSLSTTGSQGAGEPRSGIEIEPQATAFPTTTPYPTATPYPTTTPYPTPAPQPTASPTLTPAAVSPVSTAVATPAPTAVSVASSATPTPVPAAPVSTPIPTRTTEAAPPVSTPVPAPTTEAAPPVSTPVPAPTPGAATPVSTPAQTSTPGVAPTPGLFTGSGPFTTPEETELKYPKVGSILDDLIARVEAGEISAEDAAGEAPLHRGESVAVRVYLSGNVDGVVRFLQDNGVSPRHVGEDYIVAFIPILLLPQTSEQPGVLRVEESIPGKSFQSATRITGNGPAAHGSPAWNQAGYRGQGIKVGIIDDGFEGFSGLMGTELPQSVEARCYPIGSDTPTNEIADCDWDDVHGTAVAESVMDIAPEVSLYIANVDTPDDVQAAVEWMIDQEVHVINHSMGWPFDGPGDGTSQYTWGTLRSVDRAVEEGIVWVNSAGNEGGAAWFKRNPSYATMTISGEDVRVILFYEDYVGTGFHAGSLLQLRWEDSWQSAASDLALFIIEDPVGNPKSGTWVNNRQQGNNGDIPRELFAGEGIDAVFIAHLGGEEPDWVQLVSWEPFGLGGLPTDISSSGSISNPAESANPGMLTVGAAPWDDVDSIEDFSSRGPTPDDRIKPDMVGADCGDTAAYGDEHFCGTSQASPHVAGMAALVRQRFPDYSPEQVVSYLKDNAQQGINSPDPNNTWGHGFIVLPSISTDVASISDLVVDTPTVDTSAPAAGTSFTLNATVRNRGNGASVSTTLRYFLSTDSTITTGDTEVDTDSVSSLDASGSGASSISLTAPSTPDTYYYGACVDAVSDESDTTNNCSLSVAVTVGAAPAPDLVVDTPTVDTSAPAAGTSFTLNATVRNRGNGASVSTTLRYYRSTDSTITTGDTEVDTPTPVSPA